MLVAFIASSFAVLSALPWTSAFNNPAGVEVWCGKAYRPANESFNPGGWFEEPARSSVPLLNFRIKPRMNLYLESETIGSFLIESSISYLVGQPYAQFINSSYGNKTELEISIVVNNTTKVSINTTSVEIGKTSEIYFDLGQLSANSAGYTVTIQGSLPHSESSLYTATTELLYLPRRTDGGSVTRIDNLYGGLSVLKGNDTEWSLIFPYTYYVQWSLYWYANLSTLDEFAAMGYNVIHIAPTGDLSNIPFPWAEFEPYLNRADELGLYFQYDPRWDYTNLTEMINQVTRVRTHPSMLLWYTGDEPDGKGNPLSATTIAYNTIRSLDPYHPVSLALNCYDFYYQDYAAGAEIIMSDPYPISTNTSYSSVYGTVCNSTYGCCGCDDCNGVFEDISSRLDNFAHRDNILGWSKTHWGVPQALGANTFWTRFPTAAEEVVMSMLSINHAAKGIVLWDFPTTTEIADATARLASVLTSEMVTGFLLGAEVVQTLGVDGASRVDAAAWLGRDKMLLSVINLNYGDLRGNLSVHMPVGAKVSTISQTLWGDVEWSVGNSSVLADGVPGLGVSLLVLDLV